MEDDDWGFYGGSWMASLFDVFSYYDYSYNASAFYDYHEHHEFVIDEASAYIAIYIVTFLISVPGNLCIVMSVWRNKALHAAIWYILAATSISLLMQNIAIPFWIVHVREVTWTFGTFLCKLIPFINTVTFTFASMSLPAMCIIRLLSRTIMKRIMREYPFCVSVIVVVIISISSVLISFPIAVFHNLQSFHTFNFCGPMFPSWLAHAVWYMVHFVLTFALPFFALWSVNSVMFILRRKFFASNSSETVTYIRQYDEARSFHGNGCSENGGGILLSDYSNSNGSNGHTLMKDEINENGHTVMKDDLSLIVGTIDVDQNLQREDKVTFLFSMLSLTFTLIIGPLSILLILHLFSPTAISNESIYKASVAFHMIHIFFPASIPVVCFACSRPLRQGVVKPIRGVFPRSNTYTKV